MTVVLWQVKHYMVGAEHRFGGQMPHMVILSGVVKKGSLAAALHQSSQVQFCQVLRHGRRPNAHMVGQMIHRMLPMEQGPQNSKSGWVGEKLERRYRPGDLLLAGISCLRIHADNILALPVSFRADRREDRGTGYKTVVKLTFAKGAKLEDPSGLFNSSLEGNTRRAIDLHESDTIDEVAFQSLIRAAVTLNVSKA